MSYKSSMEFKADMALIAVALMWGTTFLPVSAMLRDNGVFTMLFYRFLLASFLMLPIWYFYSFKRLGIKRINRAFISGILVGFFMFLGFVTQTYALKYTQSSNVAFITGACVVFVPFIMRIIFGVRVAFSSLVGAMVAFLGLYFLSAAKLSIGLGEWLSLACALFYAVEIVLAGHFVLKYDLFSIVFFEFVSVTLFCGIGALFLGEQNAMQTEFIMVVLYTGIVATFGAYFIQNWAQKYTNAAKVVLIFTLEPVAAGILGYFVGGERFSALQIFGAALIILGILISELGFGVFFKNARDKKAHASYDDDTSSAC